ncbi:MAG: transglycosylase domain-containing protein [Eubacterium sp.]|nr:transglycosylase domain-containing protein [Eubacterium sp.]
MSYSKEDIERKMKQLKSSKTHRIFKIKVAIERLAVILVVLVAVAGFSSASGIFNGIIETAPRIDSVNVIPDGYSTRILSAKGDLLQTLVGRDANREYVTLDKIPLHLQNAFVAIEDERFWKHDGVDLYGVMRATATGLSNGGHFNQGASTLTQQLLKNQVFGGGEEKTMVQRLKRKVQEQYLAIQLENKISKNQIMEYYLNTINLGQNTLGVQAAAKRYFNKHVSKLTISEAAVIAGITQNPSGYNPITHPKKNAAKRLTVLSYMKNQGYITSDEYEEAVKDKVYSRIKAVNNAMSGTKKANSYFTDALIDQIIKDMKEKLGYTETQAYNALYRGGLTIYSTQNTSMQKIVDSVIDNPKYYPADSRYMLDYQLTVTDAKGKSHNYNAGSMKNWYAKKKKKISLYFTDQKKAKKLIKAFKKAMSKGKKSKVEGENIHFSLEPQASFVIMDQANGQVRAIAGGRGDKAGSRTLNRATTSLRQPGSTFKILSTYLPALDTMGFTLGTIMTDEPHNYPGTKRAVKNWYSGYRGDVTIRKAIEQSMNVIAVKTLEKVTPKTGYDYLISLGFTSLVDTYTSPSGKIYSDIALPMALGGLTNGVSNLELTSAFATIANGGIHNDATFYTKVVDHDGNILLDNTPKQTGISVDGSDVIMSTPSSKRVIKDTTAWLLTSAMRTVISRGTGGLLKFKNLDMPVAGKTGTTTKNKDLWFVGYTPYLTAGVWGGYDANDTQSNTTYHKIIWRTIMEKINSKYEKKQFEKPLDIKSAYICTKCGKLLKKDSSTSNKIKEYFVAGTEPTEKCNHYSNW